MEPWMRDHTRGGRESRHRRVHRHNFNGSVAEMLEWLDAVPNVYFGFSGLINLEEAHREIRHVLRRVPEDRILLESDAPHLLPDRLYRYNYSTPFVVMEVAEYIAEVHRVSVDRILEVRIPGRIPTRPTGCRLGAGEGHTPRGGWGTGEKMMCGQLSC